MLQQPADLVDRVLTVAIDLHDGVCSVVNCVTKTSAERASDSEVDRQPNDCRSRVLGDVGGAIVAGVIDHHTFVPAGTHGGDDPVDAVLLVKRGNDDDDVRHACPSRSLTLRASRACASAVVRRRSCSSETLMDSWIEIARRRTELIINKTAVGVMLATLPRRPTNGNVTAASATNAPTESQPRVYRVVNNRRLVKARMTSTITTPPSARTRACFTDVDM